MSTIPTTAAELLAAIRRIAFGSLDAGDGMRRIRDLFREYDGPFDDKGARS